MTGPDHSPDDRLELPALRSRIVCRVDARLEPPLDFTPAPTGQRRVIGVAGGTFDGPAMSGPPEVLAALRRGEVRDPGEYCFRTAVTLEAGPGVWDWVNRALFVAVAARGAVQRRL